ncbi:MAG: hypothetical protein HQL82_04970 [Magnetococcales bacterium]|nr:hypothetical protein [Magnetococcales bacterium]
MLKHLLATRFMKLDLKKYHRLVEETEASEEFQAWRKAGLVQETHFPHLTHCLPSLLGQFVEGTFRFRCRHFAVTYRADPSLPPGSLWHRLRHITQRNQITTRILEIIGDRQGPYLQSHDPLALNIVPYKEIKTLYQHRWQGEYIDESIVSRVVRQRVLFDFNDKPCPLKELLPSRSRWLGNRIVRLLETDCAEMTDIGLAIVLAIRYNLPVTSRHVGYCRARMGLPPSRVRTGNVPGVIRRIFSGICCHSTGSPSPPYPMRPEFTR